MVYFSWTSETWRWRHRNHASTITSLIAAKQTVATFHNKRCKKDAIVIFYGKKINFIYPADKTFQIIRIIEFNRAEPTCYRTNFHCPVSDEQNGAFWYIVLRIILLTYSRAMIPILELWRSLPNAASPSVLFVVWFYWMFFWLGSIRMRGLKWEKDVKWLCMRKGFLSHML